MKITLHTVLALLIFMTWQVKADAQVATTKVKEKHTSYTDSLKDVDYNYIFPILGQGAYKKGFNLPYPVGAMGNFMWVQQEVVLNNMQLGLISDNLDIPLTGVDFIQFEDNINSASTVNFRPDIWILPFLNVYGIFGYGNSSTKVNITSPVTMQTVVEQSISTTGLGAMTAFGIGPMFLSIDANWTWNKPELLDKAVRVNVLGTRLGYRVTFKNNENRNVAFWVGGMMAAMGTTTIGEIKLIDALPESAWERKDAIVEEYYGWYAGLDPNNPIDKIKIEQADKVLTPIVERIDNADGNSTVRYGMDKQVKEKWNGIVGGQFQLDKRWMFRSEVGILGDRKSFLISVNYRFLL